jgi:hypothetical protein
MRVAAVRLIVVFAISLAGAARAQEPDVPPDASIRLQRTSTVTIELGADLDGPPKNRLPPLGSARSSSMVDLL